MNEDSNTKPNSGHRRDAKHSGPDLDPGEGFEPTNGSLAGTQANGHGPVTGVKLLSVMDLVLQRWKWLVLGTVCGTVVLCGASWRLVKPKYTAVAQLMRYEAPGKSEAFKTPPVSGDTFAALIRAPELLREVCKRAVPPIPAELFTRSIKVDPDPESDLVTVQLAGRDPRWAVEVLNLYITNAVEYTRALEAKDAAVIAQEYLKKQITEMDQDISYLEDRFRKQPAGLHLSNKLAAVGGQVNTLSTNLVAGQASMLSFSKQAQRLQAAQAELYDLLQQYKEIHPKVQAKRQQIDEIQHDLGAAPTNAIFAEAGGALTPTGEAAGPELDILHIKLRTLEDGRQELIKRQREAELYVANPPGSVRVFAPANLATIKTNHRRVKIAVGTVFGAGLGLGASLLLLLLAEFMDNRLKTADDINRVTKLPVLTSLGDLREMPPHERSQWAFRTWTMLQGRLSPSANFGLVCGIISSTPGEGRSTWVSLLAEAASMTGFRVLTIATRPSPTHVPLDEGSEPDAPALQEHAPKVAENPTTNSLTTSVLASPSQVTERLTGPNSQPVVHIPLPGWVWNLERRKQWREALNQWRKIDNLVIFVELPPANMPEAILLGSNLPNMLWLAQSGSANASETLTQMETLRHARCNLVGAVLNREPGMPLRKRLPRWLSCLAILAAVQLSAPAAQPQSQDAPAPETPTETRETDSGLGPNTNLTFSVISPAQRAAWQQHLTLGSGDVLNLNLYGAPELTRTEVAIGPDGRISYLEAQDVSASGLTVDELRDRLNEALGQYRRAPHVIVSPVAFKSKKYFMLGKVNTKGVFTLDRPLTVLEALARAHGLESALVDRNLVTLVDFRRSFIARGGKRIPLDFSRLFRQGDLSQNIPIEPDDYLFFAAGDVNEVYVVGEVRLPGPVSWTPDLTIIGAVAGRGGYTERAFRRRVLVVRGSLNSPEAVVVDTHGILDGKVLNFKLQPRDIIYVNSRPFIKVEEAADLAATAFIQSMITSVVGIDVVKPIP